MEASEALTQADDGAAARGRRLLDRIIELEFTQPFAFLPLALAFIAVRLPWIDTGYGTDPDGWRVALTANFLWSEAEYFPSRLPGYPLHELISSLPIKGGWIFEGGWVWSNLSTVLISLVGVYLFAALAQKLDLPNRGALTLAFAFTPLLWINSVMTIDYMWALTFMLGAYLALLNRAPTAAGIILGLAAGFRMTSLLMLLPFWLLLWRSNQREGIRPLTTASLATTFVVYVPVLMVYGLNMLNFYDRAVPLDEFFRRLGKDGLGVIGALALLFAVVISLPRLRGLLRDLWNDTHVLVWAAVIVVYFASYTRLPHEIAYLIPLFPFGYFLLSRYLSRGLLVGVLAVVVVSGFVDVTSPGDALSGINASTFTGARIGKGMLLSDIETLDNQRDFAREVRAVSLMRETVQEPAVIMVGFIYPELVVLHKDELDIDILEDDLEAISQLSDKGIARDKTRAIEYVWLLELDAFLEFQERGTNIYFTADAARSTLSVYGYRPGLFGATKLQLSREDASIGGGAAAIDR